MLGDTQGLSWMCGRMQPIASEAEITLALLRLRARPSTLGAIRVSVSVPSMSTGWRRFGGLFVACRSVALVFLSAS